MAVKKDTVNWTYNLKEITSIAEVPEGAIGFIYKIFNITNGRYYYGRKSICTLKKRKLTAKEKALPENARKKVITEVKEMSGWKTYKGSNKPLLADLDAGDKYQKEILKWCFSKAELTFFETEAIVCSGCMLTNDCYNAWFSAKVFKKYLIDGAVD